MIETIAVLAEWFTIVRRVADEAQDEAAQRLDQGRRGPSTTGRPTLDRPIGSHDASAVRRDARPTVDSVAGTQSAQDG